MVRKLLRRYYICGACDLKFSVVPIVLKTLVYVYSFKCKDAFVCMIVGRHRRRHRLHIHIHLYMGMCAHADILCPSLSLSISLSIPVSFLLSILLSIFLALHLSLYSLHPSIYSCIHPPIHRSIHPPAQLSICPSVHLLTTRLSIYPSIYRSTPLPLIHQV